LEFFPKQCLQLSAYERGHLSTDEGGIVFQPPRAIWIVTLSVLRSAVICSNVLLEGCLVGQNSTNLHGDGIALCSSSGKRTM
jgi:hypothetical protein